MHNKSALLVILIEAYVPLPYEHLYLAVMFQECPSMCVHLLLQFPELRQENGISK